MVQDAGDAAILRTSTLLGGWAAGFAHIKVHGDGKPLHSRLSYGARGLEADESASFLRALDRGLVEVEQDGEFTLPGAAHNLNRPHLIGRDGAGATALHTEYLIQIGAYGELALDHHWSVDRLAFDMGAWDLHALDASGDVALLVEAKARVDGPNSLSQLRSHLMALAVDVGHRVDATTRRKFEELLAVCTHGPVAVWLVASGARWSYDAALDEDGRLRLCEGNEVPGP